MLDDGSARRPSPRCGRWSRRSRGCRRCCWAGAQPRPRPGPDRHGPARARRAAVHARRGQRRLPDRFRAARGGSRRGPGAAFAYSLVEAHTEGRPRGLLSASPWDPQRLRRGNYIDAMSMIRRSALLEAGGYTDDIRLHGWEDFDLWCRLLRAACAACSSPRCSAATRCRIVDDLRHQPRLLRGVGAAARALPRRARRSAAADLPAAAARLEL